MDQESNRWVDGGSANLNWLWLPSLLLLWWVESPAAGLDAAVLLQCKDGDGKGEMEEAAAECGARRAEAWSWSGIGSGNAAASIGHPTVATRRSHRPESVRSQIFFTILVLFL